MNHTIGFIGAGNMGRAMIGAILTADLALPSQIHVYDPVMEALQELHKKHGVTIAPDNRTLFTSCDIIVLAVKPQVMVPVLREIDARDRFDQGRRKVIISIAAGTRIKTLETFLYAGLDIAQQQAMPIIRVMPNTPTLVLEGMSGMAANTNTTNADIDITRTLLASMGKVRLFDETAMDAVTAVSGSGPAYVFYFMEAMIEAGQKLGLTADDATVLVQQTFKGALRLLAHKNQPPQTLRQQVTSPGGTTAAALTVFDEHNLRDSIVEALQAAAKRGAELSRPTEAGA